MECDAFSTIFDDQLHLSALRIHPHVYERMRKSALIDWGGEIGASNLARCDNPSKDQLAGGVVPWALIADGPMQ